MVYMRRRKLIWLLLAVLPLWRSAGVPTEEDVQALAVHAPRPNYPFAARLHRLQGSGIAVLTVDPATGKVTNAEMAVSTGVKILDDETIHTFGYWRFKPGTVKKVKVPIAFTLTAPGSAVRIVQVLNAPPMDQVLAPFLGKANVINAPMPIYPSSAPWRWKQGHGVYEIHVGRSGAVTEVKILKSSGDPTFDKVTLDTLLKWRLRNGPKIIELPLVFVMTPDNLRVWIP